ncbi:MAG: exodeoxyribonuclease VII large subunit [Solirubrobacterales bacterium]|nr:exodeoxyribonuclease VII large subunit [Solirubrobacterales bacterium]MCB0869739.1 exodeoxyribonuclease VII large subunit [Solirubrobacterales bacterium]
MNRDQSEAGAAPEPGQAEKAPTPVGEYARQLKGQLKALPGARITGEVTSFSQSRVQIYFELRDERGGVQATMWKREFDALKLPEGAVKVGSRIVVEGAPDYYEGGKNASPSFSFRATDIRPSGEGDLIARLAELRKRFRAEGLTELQKALRRPLLPKRIGVITAEGGAARQDLMVGLERRGWQGEIVWGFAPVQDRKAAPLITRKLGEMAAFGEVDAIVVCRGGGSLTDLWAFCDEDLCRTVAMLAVPVVSAVGHERDVTLLDDVAAVRASTPTHAADALVGIEVPAARSALVAATGRVSRAGRSAVRDRVAPLSVLAAGPGRAVRAERTRLNQLTREIRASTERGIGRRTESIGRILESGLMPGLARASRTISAGKARNAGRPGEMAARVGRRLAAGERKLETERVALRAHDPQRTLERGYARVEDRAGEPVVDSDSARRAGEVKIRFADDAVDAVVGSGRRRRRRKNEDQEEFEQISMEGLKDSE